MKFEISNIELKENSFGKNDLIISKIKVMDDQGNYIKFAKLNESLLEAIKENGVLTLKQ